MTKNEMIKAMREMVRDLGKTIKWAYQGQWHERKVVTVPMVLVCEDDTCTLVEFRDGGRLEITGWDGTEGLGDYAEKFTEEELRKVYNAMLKMAS